MKKTLLLSAILLCTIWIVSGQWSYTNLSEPKSFMGSTTHGSKAWFGGGYNGTNFLTTVEVYDINTGSWESMGDLSVPREFVGGVISCGSLIFFAGGWNYVQSYNTVDIYDTATGEWTVEHLSVPRFSMAAISHNNKVMFAGGFIYPGQTRTKIIDIYDISTGEWTIDSLTIAREGIAAAVVDDLAIFAGGMTNSGSTNRVDIYNFTDNTWSATSLSQARGMANATTVGDKVIIAGGVSSNGHPTDRVDIYDRTTGTWSTSTLSFPRAAQTNDATINGKAFFAGGGIFIGNGYNSPSDVIDIYDAVSETWSTDRLPQALIDHSVVEISDYLIVAGGEDKDGEFVSQVAIYRDPTLIQVPVDYPKIQEAINAASDGDTVLVADSTYYENINFHGKAILVASEFILDGDTNHILNTIIDGSQPVDPDLGSVVTFSSGEDTTSVLCGFTITGGTGTIETSVDYRMGGGVFIEYSGAKLLNNIIRDNMVSYNNGAYGGGLVAGGPIESLPWIVMRDNRVINNKAISSGVDGKGGGIAVFYNLVLADNEISYNEVNCPTSCDGGGASILAAFSPTILEVRGNIIRHNKSVSLGIGSDYTIGAGLVIAFPSSGIVSGNDISYNHVESADNSWGQATGVLVQEVIADEFVFENNHITNNTHIGENCLGGGMLLYNCGGKFLNNVIKDNTGTHGAGIAIQDSPDINPEFINNTITGNLASVLGGGLYLYNASACVINTIIWGNTAPSDSSICKLGSTLEVRYSDVEGDGMWPGEGNINADPGFIDDMCHINQNSNCEDQGVDSVNINQTWHYAPATDAEGTPRPWHLGIDMGAYECDIIDKIAHPCQSSDQSVKVNVSPNPFNDHTTISYELLNDTQIEISLYNGQGEPVRVLFSGNQAKGIQMLEFEALGLPAGVYFCRLTTDDCRLTTCGKLLKY
jgi:hypothetical protein